MTGGTKGGALDRRRLREMFAPQTRYASSKVMPLDDAIRTHVKPGMTIHFGYTGARPMAASNALVRVSPARSPSSGSSAQGWSPTRRASSRKACCAR